MQHNYGYKKNRIDGESNKRSIVNVNIHNHYHGPIDNLNIQGS